MTISTAASVASLGNMILATAALTQSFTFPTAATELTSPEGGRVDGRDCASGMGVWVDVWYQVRIMKVLHCAGLVGCLALLACSEPGDAANSDTANTTEALIAGSAEDVGVRAFLNDATTTFSLLDVDVALDRRAAENLIAHRDGADGIFGTSDDNPFDSLEEVDAVPQVGPATLARIAHYAAAHGWVPAGDELLGIYDGVSFTVDEAAATLALANEADGVWLDDDLGLDRRAVDSILEARPIPSVLALSELYWVGGAALSALRQAAAGDPDPARPDATRFASDLASALVDWYAAHGDDVAQMGGNTLPEAQAAVSVELVEEVTDPEEDPFAYDPAVYQVFRHPDVVWPGSDIVWFGAYRRDTGALVEIYDFN